MWGLCRTAASEVEELGDVTILVAAVVVAQLVTVQCER
jgi:hypothetical protein